VETRGVHVRVFLNGPFPRGNASTPRDERRAARAEEAIGNIVLPSQPRKAVSTWKRLSPGPMAIGGGHLPSPFGLWRDESAPQGMETVGSIVRTGKACPPVSRETDPALKGAKAHAEPRQQ